VKLVANAGIGTIAAGVAKARRSDGRFHHGFFCEKWETNGDDMVKQVVITWHCHVFLKCFSMFFSCFFHGVTSDKQQCGRTMGEKELDCTLLGGSWGAYSYRSHAEFTLD
jgi:hypothetical protein